MLVGIILSVLLVSPIVLVYVLFIRWCDRFEPEPWYLVAAAFIWGALFATFGGGMSSGYTQQIIATATGASEASEGMDTFGAVVLAPIFEEGFKGLGVALLALVSVLGLRELDGALDGAVYGGIVGLGFTLTEDILYVSEAYGKRGMAGLLSLVVLRTVVLGLSHCTFTACTGLGFGLAVESKGWGKRLLYPCLGFASAMFMHAIHNGLPARFGDAGLVVMVVMSWAIDVLFFVLLWMLVARDRRIVIRELMGEVGKTLRPDELRLVSSYLALSKRNWSVLFAKGWKAFRARRGKQLALVELAFVKHRRRRGEAGRDLDVREEGLRREIASYTRSGVDIAQ
jgi:RsiW-degrading membrane proteinase PrsW (M82 family)